MKTKILTIFILLTTTTIFAQQNQVDTIYLRNGTIVQGSVIEPDVQIKIKSTDGSTFVFPINDIEAIVTDSNVFVFSTDSAEKVAKKEPVVLQQVVILPKPKEEKVRPCVLRNAFGWDLGLGTVGAFRQFNNIPAIDIGIHYTHRFSPYFGMDFIKTNVKYGLKENFNKEVPNIHKLKLYEYKAVKSETSGYIYEQAYEHITDRIIYTDYVVVCAQLMTGLRCNTPTFYECMSGYGASRFGFGGTAGFVNYDDPDSNYTDGDFWLMGIGLCIELEAGINLTRNLSVGYVYSYQHHSLLPISSNMLRLSFSIGR